ncbi:MAG: hypothetical protein HOD92_14025 [Deltaproteobacteria bacterium]|jgi:transposase|nr:hypothetical protein [Deltaproteobacteria bacterium]MBT4526370.1 hypothetical protein [Deltaproteobacteria bacterium]
MAKNQSHADSVRIKRNLWKHHIESWKNSSLSQAAYCRQHNLKVYDFQYWKKRFKPTQETAHPSKLLPVTLTSPDKSEPVLGSSGISLLINRYNVQLGIEFNSSTLSKLIDMLEVR